ncbi:hypothetical protein OV203_19525 [Nannocystis sp. ILAH1]|uniref:hypothetical protein n=1 Tax=unclassified Nannocystis TaxID=2627009 RepID=UPI00226D7564|nr:MULTISPECIES: hypothetical protein [unclassified Nannocystis]MCY0989339.1 hypothetical protein [Nannocystis sp. ILAH1]MCY1064966.1 hypothetical protein [Nannocystis sp. RBIL2]
MAGIIVFYEGNNATQNIVQTVEDVPGQDFRPVHNDVIRSARFFNVRPGAEIRLYDDPSGAMTDDFCIINVKRVVPEYVVPTFERTYEDEFVRVTFIRNNGLDGQISRIRIN